MKVAIIGAGNVGSTLAMRVVESNIGDVVLLDIIEGIPQGKAIDISDASPILNHENKIVGTNNYKDIKDSNIIVITAGLPRKPGSSREDLTYKNAEIIKDVISNIKRLSIEPIIIVVTNPLDVMTYYAYKLSGFPKSKIMGMAGTLDTARFINLISDKTSVPRKKIEAFVLGSHGDTMVPAISHTKVDKRPLKDALDKKTINELVEKTKNRGAEIVSYLKTGSAYYSPSAGVLEILKAIKEDSNRVMCVSAYLDGEYGIKDCFIGVPARIGKKGIVEIIDIHLDNDELSTLRESAKKTKDAISLVSR